MEIALFYVAIEVIVSLGTVVGIKLASNLLLAGLGDRPIMAAMLTLARKNFFRTKKIMGLFFLLAIRTIRFYAVCSFLLWL